MNRLSEWVIRLEENRELAYSLIRIYLGVALFLRGLMLLSNPSAITTLAGAQQVYMGYGYIIGGHMVGGLLLAVGLMTRLAALLQIPILIGAVFLIHLKQGLLASGQSLELSSLVLFLLLVYVVFGAGRWSVDNRGHRKGVTAS